MAPKPAPRIRTWAWNGRDKASALGCSTAQRMLVMLASRAHPGHFTNTDSRRSDWTQTHNCWLKSTHPAPSGWEGIDPSRVRLRERCRHRSASLSMQRMLPKRETLPLHPTQWAASPQDETKRQQTARCLPQDLSSKHF